MPTAHGQAAVNFRVKPKAGSGLTLALVQKWALGGACGRWTLHAQAFSLPGTKVPQQKLEGAEVQLRSCGMFALESGADPACRADHLPNLKIPKRYGLPRIDYMCTKLMLGQITTK